MKTLKGVLFKGEGSRLHETSLWKEKRVLASEAQEGSWCDGTSQTRTAAGDGVWQPLEWLLEGAELQPLESSEQRHLAYVSVVTLAAVWRADDGAWGGQEGNQETHQKVDAGIR